MYLYGLTASYHSSLTSSDTPGVLWWCCVCLISVSYSSLTATVAQMQTFLANLDQSFHHSLTTLNTLSSYERFLNGASKKLNISHQPHLNWLAWVRSNSNTSWFLEKIFLSPRCGDEYVFVNKVIKAIIAGTNVITLHHLPTLMLFMAFTCQHDSNNITSPLKEFSPSMCLFSTVPPPAWSGKCK